MTTPVGTTTPQRVCTTPHVLGAPASLIGSEFPLVPSMGLRPFALPRPVTKSYSLRVAGVVSQHQGMQPGDDVLVVPTAFKRVAEVVCWFRPGPVP
jgi:hypothetical protein